MCAHAAPGSPNGMQGEPATLDDDAFHAEVAELLREAEDDRRPDRRRPRGNQPVEPVALERSRAELDRVLGW